MLVEIQDGASRYADRSTRVLSKRPWANTERRRRLEFDLRQRHKTSGRAHEWETRGHSGFDEFNIDEFLAQEGAEQTALIDELFRPVLVDS